MAPEQQTAFYGGDPDNFTYPRYDLDMALFRVYEKGKPLQARALSEMEPGGAADGELVFVSGHPGGTNRLDTYAQLDFQRDVNYPMLLRMIGKRLEMLRDMPRPARSRPAGPRDRSSASKTRKKAQRANTRACSTQA